MNKNSNTYIIAYAAVMVVIVAAVLSFAALSLKGVQAENARVEKMGDILRSIGEGGDADLVKDKAAYINEQYKKYIVDSYAVNVEGDRVEGANASLRRIRRRSKPTTLPYPSRNGSSAYSVFRSELLPDPTRPIR